MNGLPNDPRVKHSLTPAELLRLHREQDPASPFFKGSQPVEGGGTGEDTEVPEPLAGYYEPTPDRLAGASENLQDRAGTTTFSTEEITRAAAGLWPKR